MSAKKEPGFQLPSPAVLAAASKIRAEMRWDLDEALGKLQVMCLEARRAGSVERATAAELAAWANTDQDTAKYLQALIVARVASANEDGTYRIVPLAKRAAASRDAALKMHVQRKIDAPDMQLHSSSNAAAQKERRSSDAVAEQEQSRSTAEAEQLQGKSDALATALPSGGLRGESVLSSQSRNTEIISEPSSCNPSVFDASEEIPGDPSAGARDGLTYVPDDDVPLPDDDGPGLDDPLPEPDVTAFACRPTDDGTHADAGDDIPARLRDATFVGKAAAIEVHGWLHRDLPDAPSDWPAWSPAKRWRWMDEHITGAHLSLNAERCFKARFPDGWSQYADECGKARSLENFRAEIRGDFVAHLKSLVGKKGKTP